jgi:lipopolysaccharide transport system ATP-binding protein
VHYSSQRQKGKKYIIGHQKTYRSATFRDAMTHAARGIWQKFRHPLSPNRETTEQEEIWALKDINFEVEQGERLGIIGRNGAGKSTLLKVLSRITEPTTGTVRLKGRVSSLLEVGTGFHPELTGRENVFLNGAILGMTRREIKSKFDEIVAFAEVEKFLDTPVKRYSSGMYVRLAFAVAAHLEPEILIVDEVLAVGDAAFQKKCLGKMENVAEEGRTILFVSHNMAAIQNLCSRGILFREGKMNYSKDIDSTITKYLKESETLINTRLVDRRDRHGNGLFYFKNVNFKDADSGALLKMLRSGQNINIELEYDTKLANGDELTFGIGFFTQQDNFLFACRNDCVDSIVQINKKKKTTCSIDSFPLAQGTYYYNLIAYYKGEIVDFIKNAGIINVETGDFFCTGKLPAAAKPGVFIKFKWS